MEQVRKGTVPVPAEVWAAAAVEKGKVAVKEAAGDKAVVAARAKEKVKAKVKGAARGKDKVADKISELLEE